MGRRIAVLAAAMVMAISTTAALGAEEWIFFGTHQASGLGFRRGVFDDATGKISNITTVAKDVQAPAYYCFSKDGKFLYTCDSGATFQGQPGGGVSAFAVDAKAGTLTFLNAVQATGTDTSYVSLDHTGTHVLAANYGGGSIGVWALKADGSLGERTAFVQQEGKGPNTARQPHAFAHSIQEAPGGQFVLAADLGADKMFVYKYDEAAGTLTPNDPPSTSVTPGDGARHFAFSPDAQRVYVMTEMGSAIHVMNWDGEKGTLSETQRISTLPADFTGTSTGAEILVHPNGKFVYASNRLVGVDGLLAVFSIGDGGKLTLLEEVPTKGKMPRNFAFDPTGKWIVLTNHDGNNAVVFAVDGATGRLTQTGDPVEITYPFCPRFLPMK